MKTHLIPGLKLTVLSLILFGVIYPLTITGIAKLTTHGGTGATIEVDGKLVGFEIIGQSFESDQYFNGRPSAVGYNAAATGGSNKGPTNPDYLAQVEERIANFLKQNPEVKREDVTVDMVTASGGGLDPHISPQAASIQIKRISKARSIDEEKLEQLVSNHIEHPLWNWLGPEKVNVLKLNVALDKIKIR